MEKIEYCVICETIDEETIATEKYKFNGDIIPVCDFHYSMLQHSTDVLELLDE